MMQTNIAAQLGESLLSMNGKLTLRAVKDAVCGARSDLEAQQRETEIVRRIKMLQFAIRARHGDDLAREARRVLAGVRFYETWEQGAGI